MCVQSLSQCKSGPGQKGQDRAGWDGPGKAAIRSHWSEHMRKKSGTNSRLLTKEVALHSRHLNAVTFSGFLLRKLVFQFEVGWRVRALIFCPISKKFRWFFSSCTKLSVRKFIFRRFDFEKKLSSHQLNEKIWHSVNFWGPSLSAGMRLLVFLFLLLLLLEIVFWKRLADKKNEKAIREAVAKNQMQMR